VIFYADLCFCLKWQLPVLERKKGESNIPL
jgi:hypothetical protein